MSLHMNKGDVSLQGYCGCGQNMHNFRKINVSDFFGLIRQKFVFM